jgi:hypothetical protein
MTMYCYSVLLLRATGNTTQYAHSTGWLQTDIESEVTAEAFDQAKILFPDYAVFDITICPISDEDLLERNVVSVDSVWLSYENGLPTLWDNEGFNRTKADWVTYADGAVKVLSCGPVAKKE